MADRSERQASHEQANESPTPYQVLPPMAPEQFEALKQDIAERGVVTPIDMDDQGRVLDGHHRLLACAELGITSYPVFVRVDLKTDAEKRSFARQVNTLRRHLTRAQLRELIAGQLRDTTEWSDRRIARWLGVSDKTVRVQRRKLEAAAEIRSCAVLEGEDGKQHPATQPRAVFVANWADVTADDLVRLAAQAAALPPDQRSALWTANGVKVFVDQSYDTFAGRTDAEIREWHLFVLFLVQQCGWSVDGAAIHAEWVRGRFQTVAEWFADEAATWRRGVGMPAVPDATIRAWTAFAAERADRMSPDLISELRDLNPALHAMTARLAPRESV